MDDLIERLESNRESLVPEWDDVRGARVRERIDGARRARRTAVVAVTTMAAAAAVVLAVGWSTMGSESARTETAAVAGSPSTPVVAKATTAAAVELADGSRAVALTNDTHVALVERGSDRVRLALRRGVARFQVTPNPERTFEVEAGPVRVEVVGTVFEVARSERDVRVSVERGRVRVHLHGQFIELGAGDAHTFDTRAPVPAVEAAANEEPTHVKPASRPRGWRALAAAGDFRRSYDMLQDLDPASIPDSADVWMDAADAARFSGHPRAAVSYLKRVARDHARDARAPLAAFTMGRLLLDELGRPREAAVAFGRVQELAPAGDLTEDALAREVEAWSRAGDASRARSRARIYVERFPRGRRLGSVKKFGELE